MCRNKEKEGWVFRLHRSLLKERVSKWRRDALAVTPLHPRLVSVQPGQVQNNERGKKTETGWVDREMIETME